MIPIQDDLDRIMAVMETAFDPSYSEAWTRRQVEDALIVGHCHYILVNPDCNAPSEDEPIAGFSLSRTGFDEEELLLFAVDPRFRRRGLGATMLQQLKENARQRGANRLLLEMRKGNPAEGLYRAHGFVPIGHRPNYYRTTSGDRIDAITFSCGID